MTNFLPDNYKIPTTSNYMKFAEGKNTFRVLSSAITGWEYFTTENKPVRQKEAFEMIRHQLQTGLPAVLFLCMVLQPTPSVIR